MAIETQARAWKEITVNSLAVNRTDQSIAAAGASNSLASAKITDNWNGKTIDIGFTVHTAFSDVNAVLTVEGSLDGTNWVMLYKLSSDTQPNVVRTSFYKFDASDYSSIPYFRLHFNGGEDASVSPVGIGTSGLCSMQTRET